MKYLSESIQHYEVVDGAQISSNSDSHASFNELLCKVLSLVSQHIKLTNYNESRWHAFEYFHRCPQWRSSWLPPYTLIRCILIPEPLHGLKSEPRPIVKLLTRFGIERYVGDRVEQALFLVYDGHSNGHIATHAVSTNRKLRDINTNCILVLRNPLGRCIGFFDGDRVLRFWCRETIHEHHRTVASARDAREESIIPLRQIAM
ncbi:uncharacterized protein [Physcomitrium patens]|uniref:uncharacterized protein isoform X2 n=1 Tax=Physcomitrium patens TaxID=3218 RepID=UPI003CCD718D